MAAGFQEAVADVLTMKAVRAATELGVSTLLIAGGVAANSRLRELAEAALRGRRFDAAHPAAAAVHRQRRDDRVVRRASGRRGCAAVAAGRRQRSGSAGGERSGHVSGPKTSASEDRGEDERGPVGPRPQGRGRVGAEE